MRNKGELDVDEVVSINIPQVIDVDEPNGVIYKGHSPIGTDSLADPKWSIFKITTVGTRTTTQVANGGAGNLVYDSGAKEYENYNYTY